MRPGLNSFLKRKEISNGERRAYVQQVFEIEWINFPNILWY